MQGPQPYYSTPTVVPALTRRSLVTLVLLLIVLLAGAAIGYFAGRGSVTPVVPANAATLFVQVENGTPTTQDVRIFLNNDQVDVLTIIARGTASVTLSVGWTKTLHGMYEVRATPMSVGASDADRVIVSNGQTLLIQLRVG